MEQTMGVNSLSLSYTLRNPGIYTCALRNTLNARERMCRIDFHSFVSTSGILLQFWSSGYLLSLEIKPDDCAIYHLSKKSQRSVFWVCQILRLVFSTLRVKALLPTHENILWSLLIRNSAGDYTDERNISWYWRYFV